MAGGRSPSAHCLHAHAVWLPRWLVVNDDRVSGTHRVSVTTGTTVSLGRPITTTSSLTVACVHCGVCALYVLQVRFCLHGSWTTTSIDDHFPCRAEEGGGPIFSQASGNELWVLLIEKAYAKLQGSYYACRLGTPTEALIDLTGAPTLKLSLEEVGAARASMGFSRPLSPSLALSRPPMTMLTLGRMPCSPAGHAPHFRRSARMGFE